MKTKVIDDFGYFTILGCLIKRRRLPLSGFKPVSYRFNDLTVNSKQVAEFKSMFQCPELPCSYLYVAAQRYLAFLFVNSEIPSRLLGLIHLSTSYQQYARHLWEQSFDLEVVLTGYHQDEKGIYYHLEINAYQNNAKTLTSKNIVLDKSRSYRSKRTKRKKQQVDDVQVIESAKLIKGLARHYAKVSGDYNPIHLSDRLAKVFGMRCAVMHGMYNVHWLLTQPDLRKLSSGKLITVKFNRPCYLPTTAALVRKRDVANQYSLFNDDFSQQYLTLMLT
ncbi:MaoC/PaaZ C-terminal domain-containing protein [Thalassotalea ganghwensis]